MKPRIRLALLAIISPVILTGCATAPKVVEGPGKIVTMGIDTQDFAAKGAEMIDSLRVSGALDKAANKPAIMIVGRIINNTTEHFDTDLLAKKIRAALNKSGEAVTDITGGALSEPDFTLSGKIIESRARKGNIRQRGYTFQLSLSDRRGLTVWEDEREVTKQAESATLGL